MWTSYARAVDSVDCPGLRGILSRRWLEPSSRCSTRRENASKSATELWDEVSGFRYAPFAFEQLGFLALEFEDAAKHLGQVDSKVSYRHYQYDKWLTDETGIGINKARDLPAKWAPRWRATGGVVGSK